MAAFDRMMDTAMATSRKNRGYPHMWDPTAQLSWNEQVIDAEGVQGSNDSFSGTSGNTFVLGGSVKLGFDFFDESATNGSDLSEDLGNFGLFAQASQDIGARFSLTYGARYDIQSFTGVNGQEFDDSDFSANAAVDVVLTDTLTFNAGLASSFGGYELGEAALINTAWDYTGLTSSRGQAARAGLRYESGPFDAGVALFSTRIDDINAILPSNNQRGAVTDLVSEGIEASIGYTTDRGFARASFTQADVTLDDATIGTTAYYLGRPVGSILSLEGGFDVTEQWRLGGTAEIAFENDDTDPTLEGYQVVDLYAAYTPAAYDNVEIRLDLRNAFDETYASRSTDGQGGGRVVTLTEPGRTVQLGARVRF